MASHCCGYEVGKRDAKYGSIKFALLKQLGVIRLMNILHSKGSLSMHLLGSLFAIRASEEEKQAVGVGWKMQDMLQTLLEFPYLFRVTKEDVGYRVELNYNQQSKNVESSLALASGCLKMRDYLQINPYSAVEDLHGLLSGTEERLAWGETIAEFCQTLG